MTPFDVEGVKGRKGCARIWTGSSDRSDEVADYAPAALCFLWPHRFELPAMSCWLNRSMQHHLIGMIFLKVVFMTQGKRERLSAEQRTDMWRRWKTGESLHEIGRAFGISRSTLYRTIVRPAA